MKTENLNQILIHTCCADCFLNAINFLIEKGMIDENTNIISLYFNPNIHPRTEYYARLDALKKVISESKNFKIKLVVPDYKPNDYIQAITSRKQGSRCDSCWELRLRYLFEFAREKGIKDITSTLLTSHYQDKQVINDIAKEIDKDNGFNFIDIDESCNCKHYGFYKQNYCGCCFSLTEKLISKQSNNSTSQ